MRFRCPYGHLSKYKSHIAGDREWFACDVCEREFFVASHTAPLPELLRPRPGRAIRIIGWPFGFDKVDTARGCCIFFLE